MPAWGSHTQAPVVLLIRSPPDGFKSCFLLAPCPGFAPALGGLSTHLTGGETKAHGYNPSCGRGLGPRLRTQSSFPPAQGFPAGSYLAPGSTGNPLLYQLFPITGVAGGKHWQGGGMGKLLAP